MRKISVLLLIMLLALPFWAKDVPQSEAQRVAANFFAAKYGKKSASHCVYKHNFKGTTTAYVFAFDGGGWVIIAADDAVEPIVGYSPDGLVVSEDITPTLRWWLNRCAKHIKAQHRANGAKCAGTHPEWVKLQSGTMPLAPEAVKNQVYLLETEWNQNGSRSSRPYKPTYDKFCPDSAGSKSLVGCVATAVSQIMRYHKWPQTGRGWHKYPHPYFGLLLADFSATTYDWENMPYGLTSSSSDAEIDAVATLCYHVGVAVNMNYSPQGSGAFDIDAVNALVTYFQYNPSTIRICEMDTVVVGNIIVDGQTRNAFEVIRAEIEAKRPMLVSGSSKADGGHAFVCDGYDDATREVHINWGWGGNFDGYYGITALKPSYYGEEYADFSENVNVVLGIQPQKAPQTPISKIWVKQHTNLDYARGITQLSPLSSSVCWAIAADGMGDGFDAERDFVRTIDGGKTWTVGQVGGDDFRGASVSMIAAVDADKAFATVVRSTGTTAILETNDGGTTWQRVAGVYGNRASFVNVVRFWEDGKGFAQGDPLNGDFEVYTTADSGRTWNRVPAGNLPDAIVGASANQSEMGTVGYADVVRGGYGWFTTNMGNIYRTADYGQTWTKHTIDNSLTRAITVRFRNANEGVAFYYSNKPEVTYLTRTTDGGQTWSSVTPKGDCYLGDMDYIPGTDTLISVGADYLRPSKGISFATSASTDASSITFKDYAPYYRSEQFLSVAAAPDGSAWAGTFVAPSYGGVWTRSGYLAVEDSLHPDFTVNRHVLPIDEPVAVFADMTWATPDSLHWDFGDGAEPRSATGAGPHTVTFDASTEGYRVVSLTAYRGGVQKRVLKPHAVYVGTPLAVPSESMSAQQEAKLLLYPNPATGDYVTIAGFERGLIQLYDLQGNLLWRSASTDTDGRVFVGDRPSGVYIVRVYDAAQGTAKSQKLIISR